MSCKSVWLRWVLEQEYWNYLRCFWLTVHNFLGLFWDAVLVLLLQSIEARFECMFCLCCFWLERFDFMPIIYQFAFDTLSKCLCQHRTKNTRVHFMSHPVPCCSESGKNMKVVSSLQNIEERTSNKKSNKRILILVTCKDEHCHHVWGHQTGSCFLFAKIETLS